MTAPVFGSSLPTKLPPCTVNHSTPFRSKIGVCGSRAAGFGILYSVTCPVLGSSFADQAGALPVYQMLPSRSDTRPCGP